MYHPSIPQDLKLIHAAFRGLDRRALTRYLAFSVCRTLPLGILGGLDAFHGAERSGFT